MFLFEFIFYNTSSLHDCFKDATHFTEKVAPGEGSLLFLNPFPKLWRGPHRSNFPPLSLGVGPLAHGHDLTKTPVAPSLTGGNISAYQVCARIRRRGVCQSRAGATHPWTPFLPLLKGETQPCCSPCEHRRPPGGRLKICVRRLPFTFPLPGSLMHWTVFVHFRAAHAL